MYDSIFIAYLSRLRDFVQNIGFQEPKINPHTHVLCLTSVFRACTNRFTVTKLICCASHTGWFHNHIIDDTWETTSKIYEKFKGTLKSNVNKSSQNFFSSRIMYARKQESITHFVN